MKYCQVCGHEVEDNAKFCGHCGNCLDSSSTIDGTHYSSTQTNSSNEGKSALAGGLLNIFISGVGRMYLGYVGMGVAQLLLTFVFGIGAIWSFIDGIMILCGAAPEGRVDGDGKPLSK